MWCCKIYRKRSRNLCAFGVRVELILIKIEAPLQFGPAVHGGEIIVVGDDGTAAVALRARFCRAFYVYVCICIHT